MKKKHQGGIKNFQKDGGKNQGNSNWGSSKNQNSQKPTCHFSHKAFKCHAKYHKDGSLLTEHAQSDQKTNINMIQTAQSMSQNESYFENGTYFNEDFG